MSITAKRILILAANPREAPALKLKQEESDITNALNRARLRDAFELLPPCRGVTAREMQEKILNQEPQIVHFSGHGEGAPGIYLEDDMGKAKLVSTEGLAGLFEICDQVECVILNACYTSEQAQAIARHIPYVIGMNRAIGDPAALAFAFGFYTALGTGKSYELAYKAGCNAILFDGVLGADIPVLIQRIAPDEIPVLRIYSWGENQRNSEAATKQLDWTDYYSKSPYKIPTPQTWETELLPRLTLIKEEWARAYSHRHISLRGTLPLSVALAIGHLFPVPGGYTFDIEQHTSGKPVAIWRSGTASALKFKVLEEKQSGEDLLMVFSISRDAKPAVRKLIEEAPDRFGLVVYAEPETGIGAMAIAGAEDALALAIEGKDLMDRYRHNAPRIHVITATPAGFALFLGQQLNALGEIVAYEYNQEHQYCLAMQWLT